MEVCYLTKIIELYYYSICYFIINFKFIYFYQSESLKGHSI